MEVAEAVGVLGDDLGNVGHERIGQPGGTAAARAYRQGISTGDQVVHHDAVATVSAHAVEKKPQAFRAALCGPQNRQRLRAAVVSRPIALQLRFHALVPHGLGEMVASVEMIGRLPLHTGLGRHDRMSTDEKTQSRDATAVQMMPRAIDGPVLGQCSWSPPYLIMLLVPNLEHDEAPYAESQ